ncbi:MAG: GTPase, partial [Solirubrobacteraceae bacterium]|nr:GTPase [Solirubrobacteraceae bacterium]
RPGARSGVTGAELGARLREGDLDAAPAVLNLVESTTAEDRRETADLLRTVSPAALGGEARAHIIGVTGPPGVGKSTLLSALVGVWRRRGRTVAALAVDPSSKRSGGALLGDRARIAFDPGDRGVFVRSTATAHRLGGLAPATRAGAHALAVAFDIVVVETVGVGQSETEVADLADTVMVVLQPGSGDTLQFLKSGIMEIPDLLVVTKSDMGRVARATLQDARSAAAAAGSWETPTLAVSSVPPTAGVEAVADALDAHRAGLDLPARRLRARRAGALADFVTEHGEHGLRRLGGRRAAERWLGSLPAGLDGAGLVASLEGRAGRPPHPAGRAAGDPAV